MKKTLALLVTLIMLVSLVLSGCSNKSSDDSQDKKVDVTPAGKFPITKHKVTLKAMVLKRPGVKKLSTNSFTKWYEDKTNVHLDIQTVPQDQAQEKLNLALTKGKYPDIIVGVPIGTPQQLQYGKKGIFLSLNDLIDKYGYGTKRLFDKVNNEKKILTAPDGKIYGLPFVDQNPHTYGGQKMWVYKPWLDKLGLDVPKTTDDFYKMLEAFKTKDPNGNGKQDEIPLTASQEGWHMQLDDYLMSAFIPTNKNVNPYMILHNGKVDVVFNKPEWKKGLKYLHRLYKDGLIDSGAFTNKMSEVQKEAQNPKTPIVGAIPSGDPAAFSDWGGKDGRYKDWVTIPPLEGPDGTRVAPSTLEGATNDVQFVITKEAKHPDVAFRWADMMYTKEVTTSNEYGVRDKQWRWAKDDEKGLDGEKGVFKKLEERAQVQNHSWVHVGPGLNSYNMRKGAVPFASKGGKSLEKTLYDETIKNYKPYAQKPDTIVPPLFFSVDDANDEAKLHQTIYDYMQEMKSKFVTGKADIDKDWNKYLNQLKQMGLDQLLKIYQDAYDKGFEK